MSAVTWTSLAVCKDTKKNITTKIFKRKLSDYISGPV